MAVEIPVTDYPMFIDGVMLELTGEPEKGWHYTIFGDKPAEQAAAQREDPRAWSVAPSDGPPTRGTCR